MAQLKQVCTVTNGSQTVTVIGVNVAYRIRANNIFMTSPDLVPYTVAKDAEFDGTNTVVTLAASYQGDSGAMAQGVFVTDFTYPDNIPLISQGDVGTAAIWTKAMYQLQEMIGSVTPAGLTAFITQINATQKAAADARDAALASQTAAKTSETNSKTSETNAAASKTAAKTSETNAKTSETNSKTSETNSAASAKASADSATASANSATASAGSATAAGTSERNASGSAAAALASQGAAKTSETNSKTSETNASGSAAAALASQGAAKTSETNAKTSETNAKTSETNSKTSETNAKTSETNAAASAGAAAADRATVQGILKTMNALYLGKKASDPTTDNNGDPLQVGAEYWNVTKALMRVYTASGWRDEDADAQTQAANATASASAAAGSAAAASTSAANASTSEQNAKTSETNSKTSETNAKTSEQAAAASKQAAATSEGNAKTSETNAKTSEQNAAASAAHADQVAATIGNPVSKNGDTMTGDLWVDGAKLQSTRYGTGGAVVLRGTSGTQASPTALAAGSQSGIVAFRGYDGANYQDMASIDAWADADVSSTASAGQLRFSTTPAGSVNKTERMRITSTGRVLIGTVTDDGSNMLQVAGSVAIGGNQTFTNTTNSTIGSISSSAYAGGLSIEAFNVGNTAKKNLALSPWGGRVLVGTATDDGATLLQVNGAGKFAGQLVTAYANPINYLNDTSGSGAADLRFQSNAVTRWSIQKSSANNFNLARFDSTGVFVDNPLSFATATGIGTFTQVPVHPTAAAYDNGTNSATTAFVYANAMGLRAPLGGSVDLNTITTSGVYHQPTNANATTALNYPTTNAGMLEVYTSGSMTYQTYTRYDTGVKYTRSYYNGTWYAWKQLVDTANASTITGATTFSGTTSFSGASTFTGGVTTNAAAIEGGAAYSTLYFRNGGKDRWQIYKDNVAESTGNAGGNFGINAVADNGTTSFQVLTINRATYQMQLNGGLQNNGTGQKAGLLMQNTTASTGRKWSVYSNDGGSFVLGDETAGIARLAVNSNGLFGMTGDLQLNAAGTTNFSYRLLFVNGSYAPFMRSDNNGSIQAINSANTNVNLTIADNGNLTVRGVVYSQIGQNTSSGAFRTTSEIGGAFVDWSNNRTFAVQVDAPNAGSAYGGIRWTRWGARHLAAIDAYEGGSASTQPTIVFHIGTQGNAWTFGNTDITRGAGGYVWGSWNFDPNSKLSTGGGTITNELNVLWNGDQGYQGRFGPGYVKLARYDYGAYIDLMRSMNQDYLWRIHYNINNDYLEFIRNGNQTVSFSPDGNIYSPAAGWMSNKVNRTGDTFSGTVWFNGATTAGYTQFGYINAGAASTYTGGTNNGTFSIFAANMIAASQVWAVSDRRLKTDIEDVSEDDAVRFVVEVAPKRYLKEGVREWGYLAQDVGKSMDGKGSELVTLTEREGLEEEIDDDGFVSPADHALNVSHNQIIPIHGAVLRKLLREADERDALMQKMMARIESLEAALSKAA
jgi:uncharacterized coiled-coil DUF342 family protein